MITSFLLNIFFAFLGGLVMNFMPCILPLISLKISSFLQTSDYRKTFISKNFFYISGILSFFLLFGILLSCLKMSGIQIIIGSQMQSGGFLLTIFTILLLIGFNLSGLFEINFSKVVSATGEIESKLHRGKIGDYFNGFFVSLLAVPCTAPFISTALTYGLTASTFIFFTIIISMGIGFASPFIFAIFFSDKILKILPKPGSWMIKFKEFLAFPIYATAGWILFVLMKQSQFYYGSVAIFLTLFLLFFFWLHSNFEKMKFFYRALILLSILLFGYFILPKDQNYIGKPLPSTIFTKNEYGKKIDFSYDKLKEALEKKQKVFVVVSASWCITCHVNEKNALSSEKFFNSLKENEILYLYADMTNDNEEASRLLKEHNRLGIPLYLLFDTSGQNKTLPQILTEELVLNEFQNLK
jgi:thiol:disulfide interchange protein